MAKQVVDATLRVVVDTISGGALALRAPLSLGGSGFRAPRPPEVGHLAGWRLMDTKHALPRMEHDMKASRPPAGRRVGCVMSHHGVVWYDTGWCWMVWYGTAQYSTL